MQRRADGAIRADEGGGASKGKSRHAVTSSSSSSSSSSLGGILKKVGPITSRKIMFVVLALLGLRALLIVNTALPGGELDGNGEVVTEEERAQRRWADHEERQKERERAREKVNKKKQEDKEAIERQGGE